MRDTNDEASPADSDDGVSSTMPAAEGVSEIKRRAFAGVMLVSGWNLISLLVAFLGNVVLARLLTPQDFGVVAIGATVLLVVGALTEGGMGAGLLRRPERPVPAELRTLTGVQLALTATAALLISAVALPFGTGGAVVAFMSIALPIFGLQTASRVMLNRDIQFRWITIIDAIGIVGSYAWSIAAVLAGLGVWGLASGSIARAVASTVILPFIPGGQLYRPTLEKLREFRPLVRFGIRFQLNWVVIVLRDQALNVVILLIAGVSTLGLSALAFRVLQVANVLGDAVGRVMFPTIARLLSEGEDVRPVLERAIRLTATVSAIFLAGFVASTPGLVPALFGPKWSDVIWIFPGATLGVMIASTIVYSSVGYLYAADRPGVVARASVAHGVGSIAATACLLPVIGVAGIGVGVAAGAIADGIAVVPMVHRLTGAKVVRPVVRPLIAGVLGATPGWLLANSRGDFLSGVAGGALAAGLTFTALVLLARDDVRDVTSVLGKRSAYRF